MESRLKEIRKNHPNGKTQDTFADYLGISKSNLASYESGRRAPSEAAIQLICQKCDVNEDWLKTGNGEPYIKVDKENQLMTWAGNILKDESDSFKRRFVNMLMDLDEDGWDALEKMALLLQKKD